MTRVIATILLLSATNTYAQQFSNWGYWLTAIDHMKVASSEYDLVVIDYSRTGSDHFTSDEVQIMKKKPSGENRTLLSYFSIGEAEIYRPYWKKEWNTSPPTWLDEENPDWPGNYKVQYWDPNWQSVLFGNQQAYLDKIIEQGFDGVYLDIIDAFEFFESTRPSAEREMVDLIKSIASYARSKNPNFIIVTQNGERLLAHADLLQVIDGAAKEDLYYGLEGDNIPAPKEETAYSLQFYNTARNAGKFLLLASYVHSPAHRVRVNKQATLEGFISYFGPRDLDRLNYKSGLEGDVHNLQLAQESHVAPRTPGDFFLNTLNKHQLKLSIGGLIFDESSIYSEEDDEGTIVFSENVSFVDRRVPVWIEYGLTDRLEVGIRLPFTSTSLELEEFIGGNATSRISDVGLGNIVLTANYSVPFRNREDLFSLVSFEYGIPTDTKGDILRASSFSVLNYTIEKIWEKVGLAGNIGLANFNLSNSIEDTELTYRASVLGILSDRLFADLTYSRRVNGNFLESSLEILSSKKSSIEFFFSRDLEPEIEVYNYGLNFSFFY